MSTINGRRPLKVRNLAVSNNFAKWLSQKNITPNQISILSVVFSGLSAMCLLILPVSQGVFVWLLPLLSALFIQLRLLCNLLDGMVAIEGGKSTASGELFNDIPDRVADLFIFISAGCAISVISWGAELGIAAGVLAVLTAYIRVLSASIGAPVNFVGPMAKQHRMAVMTAVCVITAFESLVGVRDYSLIIGLVVINIGCVLTLYNRIQAAYLFLEGTSDSERGGYHND